MTHVTRTNELWHPTEKAARDTPHLEMRVFVTTRCVPSVT